jgi:energy-coupling factor transport system permease protein
VRRQGTVLFQRRDSWAERWDPRSKLIFTLVAMAGLLCNRSLPWAAALAGALLLLWFSARLPWRPLLYLLASTGLLLLSTLLYHLLLAGAVRAGLAAGVAACLRIAGVALLLAFLVHSTPPLALAEGLESLLSPLKRWRVPVHDGVMIFTIALRFLPLLLAEFDKIRKAQIARGASFHRGSLPRRLKGLLPLLIPVFVQSLLRAEELATAMEARCYRGDEGRTPSAPFRFVVLDGAMIGAALVGLVGAFLARRPF